MSSVFDSLNVKYHKAMGNMRGEFRQEVRAGDIILTSTHREDFPGGTVVKNSPGNAGDSKRLRFNPRIEKIPQRREWLPTPGFLLGEPHEQGSLAGYSPWACKDTTEQLTFSLLVFPQMWTQPIVSPRRLS